MTARTPDEAKNTLCPLSRTFGASPAVAHCQGPLCAVWRWQPLSSSFLTSAVQSRLAEIKAAGEKAGHKEAVAWVMERRKDLGIPTDPTHGFCGMGGVI